MQAANETELARALTEGAEEALASLYDHFHEPAYSVALRVLGDPMQAQDVLQDCFLKLWTNSSRFDAQRGSLRTWVLTTVRNRSIDYLRGRRAHERQEREIPADSVATGVGSDPWREVAALIDRRALQEALASLPTEQRVTIELVYFGGYSQPEVARLQGVPLSTVKGRIRLGIRKLHVYVMAQGLVYEDAHDEIENLVAAYVLGVCEDDEAEVVQAHLEMCARCRTAAGHFRRAVSVLPLGVSESRPPTELRQRILSEAGGQPARPNPGRARGTGRSNGWRAVAADRARKAPAAEPLPASE